MRQVFWETGTGAGSRNDAGSGKGIRRQTTKKKNDKHASRNWNQQDERKVTRIRKWNGKVIGRGRESGMGQTCGLAAMMGRAEGRGADDEDSNNENNYDDDDYSHGDVKTITVILNSEEGNDDEGNENDDGGSDD